MKIAPNQGSPLINYDAKLHAASLALQTPEARQRYLESLTTEQVFSFFYNWPLWARPDQITPETDDWTTWLVLGGRGAGKTRTGAEWIRSLIEADTPEKPGKCQKIALVGETYSDIREVMIDGPSGLRQICREAWRPAFEVSRRRLCWPNGAIAYCFSAEDPDSIRGYQFEAAWADELCKWRYPEQTWENLQLALRLGDRPRQVATTTPRPMPLLRTLMAQRMTHVTKSTTYDNEAFLADTFLSQIAQQYHGTRIGRQELLGEILTHAEGALWSWKTIEQARVSSLPDLDRIVVAVDPPVTSGDEADECGIIVAGVRTNQNGDRTAYVISDHTVSSKSPLGWAKTAIDAFYQWEADRLVAEVNQGGDMVKTIILQIDKTIPYRAVRATRSKITRAEPVAALYEAGRVKHVGAFPDLEDQLTSFEGKNAAKSPDRLDAMVWALTDLMLVNSPVFPYIRQIV